ncbi:MAG: hypothetical protein ACRETL_13265, partial [Gammaproteobacteria bacterium]
ISPDGTQLDIAANATMPSGVSSRVHFVTNLNSDCVPTEVPVVRLVEHPAHGEIDIVPAEDFPTYTVATRARNATHCELRVCG